MYIHIHIMYLSSKKCILSVKYATRGSSSEITSKDKRDRDGVEIDIMKAYSNANG
jgi:hypothetical protein